MVSVGAIYPEFHRFFLLILLSGFRSSMVKISIWVFPAYYSLIRDEQRLAMEFKSFEFKNTVPTFPILCQRANEAHPLGIFYGENPLEYSFSLVLFEIVLVIVLSRIVRFLLKPLRQPRVVSDIIGGILVGPSVLGSSKAFRHNVFPAKDQFLVANIGLIGFMFFLFLAGVEMDLTFIAKTGRKHLYAAFIGVFWPLLTTCGVGFYFRSSMDTELARVSGFGGVAAEMAITSFPVIYLILKELNLLSSEIGRMALTTALVTDCIGIIAVLVFEAMKQGEAYSQSALWYVISTLIIAGFFLVAIRRVMHWILKRTPEGSPADQNFVIFIVLGALIMGFCTDMFGLAIANGSLWFGLIIPDGPPLGATIVDKCETIVMELFMPFSFALVGLYTDVFAMAEYGWPKLAPLFAIVMVGYLSKLTAVLFSSLYFEIPIKDSLALSLICNLRGQLDLIIFIHWMDKKIIGTQMFTMLVLLTTVMTGIFTPLISLLYNPTKPYMINKRRTIQHNPPGNEMRMVVCFHDKENLVGLIDLLEISYPTSTSPFSIYALHLIELVGRRTSLLIDHEHFRGPSKHADHGIIYNALKSYKEARDDYVKLRFYTALTVKRTMYQDVCKLALVNKASLIILPFEKGNLESFLGTEIVPHGNAMQSLCSNVISHAPCSVGILVDKGNARNPMAKPYGQSRSHRYVMLFLGGPDAREALAYADRMTLNPQVALTVIRFLAHNNQGDDEMEKRLDDGVVTSFWVKNEGNDRVIYREVVVKDGAETLEAIRAFNDDENDLWIMGRKQGINPTILEGLSTWSESQELGVMGDYVASIDFGSKASVLVVHQQIMRVQGTTASEK